MSRTPDGMTQARLAASRTRRSRITIDLPAFWNGTRDHDVNQNYAAFLDAIEGDPPYSILDLGCGPGKDSVTFDPWGTKLRAGRRSSGIPRSRSRLCPSESRPSHAADRSPSSSTRTIGVPGLHDGAWLASRAARVHRARRRRGTESSNPSPSSGESTANLTFGAHSIAPRGRRDRNGAWHVTYARDGAS
jgi:hypothetical protein